MIRHVIVEGPDGSGKDTLIKELVRELGLAEYPRASTSTGGPLPNLEEWLEEDLRTISDRPPSVYNRHPLVSEPIYARIARGVNPQGRFGNLKWVQEQKGYMSQYTMLVMCMPPLRVIRENVLASMDSQMPGVYHNLNDIYRAYNNAPIWPGIQAWYDYTMLSPWNIVHRVTGCMGVKFSG